MSRLKLLRQTLFLSLALCTAGTNQFVLAEEAVVVIVSADAGPYKEAADAFSAAFGQPHQKSVFGDERSQELAGTNIVIAIGGRATEGNFNFNGNLISCLSPGVVFPNDANAHNRIAVEMVPSPQQLLQSILEIQPSMQTLGILWSGEASGHATSHILKVSQTFHVDVKDIRCENKDAIPAALRALAGKIDSLWLPPDPLLVTPETFLIFKTYSLENHIPLYVSIPGLVEKGAAVGITTNFASVGETAAAAAKDILAGKSPPSPLYPTAVNITINTKVCEKLKLNLTDSVLKKVRKVGS